MEYSDLAWEQDYIQSKYEEEMRRYPRCDCCGDTITQKQYLRIWDKNICPGCVEDHIEINMEAILE